MADVLGVLRAARELSALDEQVARGLGRIGAETRPEVLLGAALASRATRHGHVCLDLRRFARPPVEGATWPPVEGWRDALETSPLVGGADGQTPLVLDGDRLYLRRYFRYEARLAEALEARLDALDRDLDGAALRAGLDRLFPRKELKEGELDAQRLAALVAVARRFCIISGGPGTGKTTTVVKILALLAEQARLAGRAKLHVTLVAPTGKAAARLREAILAQRAALEVSDAIRAMIPDHASTIHRALGVLPGGGSGRFRHDADHPLPTDVLLVDEASMVDLGLMTKVVLALPQRARLILLGDRNQLASVEAGAILGDLCKPATGAGVSRAFAEHVRALTGDALPVAPRAQPKIADAVVELRRNYRYEDGSGIAALAQAINDGDAEGAEAVLASGRADVTWHPDAADGAALGAALRACVVRGYEPYLRAREARACEEALGRFRVLAAHRRGALGVEGLNERIADALAEEGLLRPVGPWYARRPVLIRANDYQVGLFNGDVGVVLPDPDDGDALRAWFFTPEGAARRLAPSRLPPHETVFAMTVHKSQGSEFDEVAVVLPKEASAILTRELLYTAVTRARRRVVVFGAADVIRAAVRTPIERASGLAERLSG